MTDAAYIASVRAILDESWKDIDEFIARHMLDVIFADRLRSRIKGLVMAERVLMDKGEKP